MHSARVNFFYAFYRSATFAVKKRFECGWGRGGGGPYGFMGPLVAPRDEDFLWFLDIRRTRCIATLGQPGCASNRIRTNQNREELTWNSRSLIPSDLEWFIQEYLPAS